MVRWGIRLPVFPQILVSFGQLRNSYRTFPRMADDHVQLSSNYLRAQSQQRWFFRYKKPAVRCPRQLRVVHGINLAQIKTKMVLEISEPLRYLPCEEIVRAAWLVKGLEKTAMLTA